MHRNPARSFARVVLALFALGLAACNPFDLLGEDENEVRVTVSALGADFLDADDGFRYQVDSDTEFEGAGLAGLADLAVGDVVEIEWAAVSADTRRALEIESGDHDESGADD